MSLLLSALSLPLIALLSIPLLILSAITTSIALGTLLIRGSIIYVELALALLHSALHPPPPPTRTKIHTAPLRRKSSTTVLTPRTPSSYPPASLPKHPSFSALTGPATPFRDYEGVGGWDLGADASSPQERERWNSLTARLELPALSPTLGAGNVRRRRKSVTAATPTSRRSIVMEGSTSPEGYFAPVFTAGGGSASTLGLGVALVESPGSLGRAGGRGSWSSINLRMAGMG